MLTVHKYPLALTETQDIALPIGAKLLHVADQRGVICIWALVDTDVWITETHVVHIVGTGQPAPSGVAYVGTVQVDGFVWHLFTEEP